MPKVLRHLLLALFLIATQRVALAGEVITPGVRHDEGGARWADSLRQWVTEGCVERYRAQGVPEICGDYYIGPIEATLDNPDDFYPPGPIRRQETGETVIEFTADPGSLSARDIALVQTSGSVDLDSAAIRLGRALRISSSCASQRIRRSILFDMSLDPRDTPERGVGCLVVRPPAMVLVVPTDAR
jgi:hypothetical protein